MDDYLKSMGYTPINYTSKITSIHKYFEMILEALQPTFERYPVHGFDTVFKGSRSSPAGV
jgi:hypothetical protein